MFKFLKNFFLIFLVFFWIYPKIFNKCHCSPSQNCNKKCGDPLFFFFNSIKKCVMLILLQKLVKNHCRKCFQSNIFKKYLRSNSLSYSLQSDWVEETPQSKFPQKNTKSSCNVYHIKWTNTFFRKKCVSRKNVFVGRTPSITALIEPHF